MTIGQLARQAGVGASTLRYYEQLGLLRPVARTQAGYRVYGRDAVRRLAFIRRAQTLGFALEEIADLLALSDNPHASAAEIKRLTRDKIADIDTRIQDLERMKQGLAALEGRCSGQGSTTDCPILSALAGDDTEPVGPEAGDETR
jgi:Cu(I)-responsive transcriptional regulator